MILKKAFPFFALKSLTTHYYSSSKLWRNLFSDAPEKGTNSPEVQVLPPSLYWSRSTEPAAVGNELSSYIYSKTHQTISAADFLYCQFVPQCFCALSPTEPEKCVELLTLRPNCMFYINGQEFEQLHTMKCCVCYYFFLRPLFLSIAKRDQKRNF